MFLILIKRITNFFKNYIYINIILQKKYLIELKTNRKDFLSFKEEHLKRDIIIF